VSGVVGFGAFGHGGEELVGEGLHDEGDLGLASIAGWRASGEEQKGRQEVMEVHGRTEEKLEALGVGGGGGGMGAEGFGEEAAKVLN
jgi:hypothetical protein